jgi:hypothetical protein
MDPKDEFIHAYGVDECLLSPKEPCHEDSGVSID